MSGKLSKLLKRRKPSARKPAQDRQTSRRVHTIPAEPIVSEQEMDALHEVVTSLSVYSDRSLF